MLPLQAFGSGQHAPSADTLRIEDVCSFWFGRFRVQATEDGKTFFRDTLSGRRVCVASPPRVSAVQHGPGAVACLRDVTVEQRSFFEQGLASTLGSVPLQTSGKGHTGIGWQFPCRTEQASMQRHWDLQTVTRIGEDLHVYLGFPWATHIDQARRLPSGDARVALARREFLLLGIQVSGLKLCLAEMGVRLQVHTVCQHVYWQDLMPTWRRMCLDHIWLSHLQWEPAMESASACPFGTQIELHPWALHAVNIEEAGRSVGLTKGKHANERPVLASFMGAHAPHYLSNIRERLLRLNQSDGFIVELTGSKWHFEEPVYGRQILADDWTSMEQANPDVMRYNRLLSDSVFALCPPGAGPNTLRLWEALATGCVPVLVGAAPVLPTGGSLPVIDWDRIVLRCSENEVDKLPMMLRKISKEDIGQRQQFALEAYDAVRVQRCF